MLGAILGDRQRTRTKQTEKKNYLEKIRFQMTIEISIETILYVGTAIMLTLSLVVVLTVYFLYRNLTRTTQTKIKQRPTRALMQAG